VRAAAAAAAAAACVTKATASARLKLMCVASLTAKPFTIRFQASMIFIILFFAPDILHKQATNFFLS
jgi:hypothetical protein